jgi:uncharacterized protein (TIGR02284 family)
MVTTTNELVIEAFNRLLAVCKASEQAFRLAAQAVHDSDLKILFRQVSYQRARMASEIRSEIRLLGGEPEMLDGMTMPAACDGVAVAAVQDDDHFILAACERMQDAVDLTFSETLLDTNIPPELLIVHRKQYAEVRQSIERLHALKQPLAGQVS